MNTETRHTLNFSRSHCRSRRACQSASQSESARVCGRRARAQIGLGAPAGVVCVCGGGGGWGGRGVGGAGRGRLLHLAHGSVGASSVNGPLSNEELEAQVECREGADKVGE